MIIGHCEFDAGVTWGGRREHPSLLFFVYLLKVFECEYSGSWWS
jgi:hypothetical protein